jgi:hypothetical protein
MSTPTPQQNMDRNEFFEAAMQADFPDEMAFQLDRADPSDPQTTFSQEGVNELAEQFRMFLMARIVGRGERTGTMPKHLRAMVTLDWNPRFDPVDDPSVGPFYHIGDDQGLEPIDHTRRHVWRKP